MKKTDSKYFQTAARMDEAFLTLLQKKEFAYITVKEICAAAGVNRSTFYLHYETMGDLLEESVHYVHKQFQVHFERNNTPDIQNCAPQDLLWIRPKYLIPYLNFIQEHQQLYRASLKYPAIFQTDHAYRQLFQQFFNPILERFAVPEEERHYCMVFYLNGITAIVEEWVRNGCKDSMEQVIAVMQRCIPQPHSMANNAVREAKDA